MTDAEIVKAFEHTIYTELRAFGVVLHNDVGERLRPGSGEENRVVAHMARTLAQVVVAEREVCQTGVGGSPL